MTSFSLRLPESLESRLNREAQEEGLPRSEIARTAIEEFLNKRERERFMAAFVNEARAAYATPALRQEALELAAESLPLDNEALAGTERPSQPRKGRK